MSITWNRLGGLLTQLGKLTGIPPAVSLAVWMVECGGLPFMRGRPTLRFENHKFFSLWGVGNEALFDAHFQFGGRNQIEGRAWEQHRFRPSLHGEWRRFHGDQSTEYAAFALAAQLAGRESACRSASFGGPQIMGFNHALTGYGTATEMFQAFARSERWQVCGFFDFCQSKALTEAIRTGDWRFFAEQYNGPGNAAVYAAKIEDCRLAAARLLAGEQS